MIDGCGVLRCKFGKVILVEAESASSTATAGQRELLGGAVCGMVGLPRHGNCLREP